MSSRLHIVPAKIDLGIALGILLGISGAVGANPGLFLSYQASDPWLYLGYFLNFSDYVSSLHPGSYCGARLSFLIPGVVLFKLLPPLAANYVLHLLFYGLGTLSAYWAVSRLFGWRTGLLAALLLGTQPDYVLNMGWNHPSGAAMAYYLATLALTVRAAASPRPLAALAGVGVLGGGMLHAHLFIVLAALPLPLLYLGLRREFGFQDPPARLWRHGLAVMAGMLGLTLILGVFSFSQGGEFWFILDSFNYIGAAGVFEESGYTSAFDQWFPFATYLILPALAALAGGFRLIRNSVQGSARLLVWNLLLAGGTFLAVHLLTGHHVLQYWNYGAFLLPPAVLAAVALLREESDSLRPGILIGLAVLGLVGLALPLDDRGFLSINRIVTPKALTLPLTLTALGLAAVAAGLMSRGGRRWPAVAALLAVGLSITAPRPERPEFLGELHRLTLAGMAALREMVTSGVAGYWYDGSAPDSEILRWLPNSGAWRVPFVARSNGQLIERLSAFVPGGQMIVASRDPDAVNSVRAALAAHGADTTIVDQRRVAAVTFTLLRRPALSAAVVWLAPVTGPDGFSIRPAETAGGGRLTDPSLWAAQAGAVLTAAVDGLGITTGRMPSGYAAALKQPMIVAMDGTYYLRVMVRMGRGGAAVGFLAEDGSRWLGSAVVPIPPGRMGEVVLQVEAHKGDRLRLMISNAYPSGRGASDFTISAMDLAVLPRALGEGRP